MSSLRFVLKHHMATILCLVKGQTNTNSYRSLMFHSVYGNTNTEKDLYSLSFSQFQNCVRILKKLNFEFVKFDSCSRANNRGLSLTFDDGFKDNLQVVLPFMLAEKIPFTIFVVSDFVDDKYPNYLSRDDLRELAKNELVTLGAHGKTHRPLTEIDFAEAATELRHSKSALEDITSREVIAMSFPHGKYNSKLVEEALKCGYKKIGTSDPFPNKDNQGNLINRQCIYSCDTNLSFSQKVTGRWDWVW